MQIVRNMGYVKEQQRRGRLFTAVGLVGLAGAFAAVFLQQQRLEFILFAYGGMLIGYIFFTSGLQTVSKFVSNSRKQRADQALDKALGRLNDRYTIIHYAQLGKRVVEHALVHNTGVLVVTVRELPGKVVVNDRRWRKAGSPFSRFFTQSGPQLGNPTLENEADIAAIKTLLAEEGRPDVPVEGVVVFTNPAAEVTGSATLDVTDLQGLPDYVRSLANEPGAAPLPTRERQALVEALSVGTVLEQATTSRTERKRRAA